MVTACLLLFAQFDLIAGETRTIILKAGFFFFFAVKKHLCSDLFVLALSVIMLPILSLHYNDQFLHTAHITKLRRTTGGKILYCSSNMIQKL